MANCKVLVFLIFPIVVSILLTLVFHLIPLFAEREIFATTCELARMYDYHCEEHSVTTEDGFILTLHRVASRNVGANSEKPSSGKRGKPILLMHCLECDSSIFLSNTPEYSLGFILASNGLDVWLGNTRGTAYSMKHARLSIDESEFWNFTWQEMAQFDLPACIDYILSLTGFNKTFYLGHSQGSLIGFTQMSQDPKLQSKIEKAYMLSPFVTLQNIRSYVMKLLESVENFGPYFDNRRFLPLSSDFMSRAATFFCPSAFTHMCTFVYYQFSGYSGYEHLNASRVSVYFSHALSGTSLKNIRHYAQLHLGKRPRFFDHMDSALNVEKYGSEEPPEVDVTRIGTPVALFAGQNDWLVSSQDIQFLKDRLPNVFMTSNCSDFAHLDFMWGMHAVECVYNSIIDDIVHS